MRIFEIQSTKQTLKIAHDFISWACKKLGINSKPDVKFSNDIEEVKSKRTFGTTHPTGEIWVYVGDRNTADMLRTLCHELVHYKQFEKGTANDTMDKEQHQKIEDEANAIAGRLMRQYGKNNVEIYENNSIAKQVVDSLPQAFAIPSLTSSNPYEQYKFGVAIAKARGKQQRLNDGITSFDNQSGDLNNYFADSEVIVSFDPNIDKIIDAALKDIGVANDKRRIGVAGSKESKDVTTVSPINPFKGYKK